MTTYGGIIENDVPLPLLLVVPAVPLNEPVEIVDVVLLELPLVVPVVPEKVCECDASTFNLYGYAPFELFSFSA